MSLIINYKINPSKELQHNIYSKTIHRVLKNIPGYLQVLSMSKRPFSRLYCKQFLHHKADAKGILKSHEYKDGKNCFNVILKCCTY